MCRREVSKMSFITIVHPQGRGSTDIVESGKHLALEPGDKVVIDADHTAMTTALKAESSLIFAIHNKLNYTIDNFFAHDNNQIAFRDITFSTGELADKLIVKVRVTDANGLERDISALPLSTIHTH